MKKISRCFRGFWASLVGPLVMDQVVFNASLPQLQPSFRCLEVGVDLVVGATEIGLSVQKNLANLFLLFATCLDLDVEVHTCRLFTAR